ncbi:MAG: phosphate regulon sensor histidine kinase PhoR [Betaproteobacteria bacterium]|nr:phosphate regulon sensor histidine kinase PhoR [Betaproteobacteria bacterium]
MKQFFKYVLGALLAALIFSTLISLAFGRVWGIASLTLFMAAAAARDSWQLLKLNRWLARHQASAGYQPGGIWSQVFGRLHGLERHAEQTQQKLRDALERFQRAGAALPNGVIVIDQSDRILWCNPSAERHFGIALKQDRGQSLTYLIRHADFAEYLQSQPSNHPFILRRVRGTDLSLSLEIVPLSEEERMLVTHDITQMERDEQVRRDFVANVSHELRTPLTVVGGYIETLLDGETLDVPMQRRVLSTMRAQTQRMQNLVEELLSLSRLESQHAPAPDSPVPVSPLLQQLFQMARHLSNGQHDIQCLCDSTDSILGSESELMSAFSNLVTNAVRYTPPGGKITLQWRRERGDGLFTVQDSGIGIAPEHLPRLTERFYRVDRARSRETGGTGLGLAIVKQVAMHHDSKLEISSESGKGSTFAFRVPQSRIVPGHEDHAPEFDQPHFSEP